MKQESLIRTTTINYNLPIPIALFDYNKYL